jgi:hypothetical protein
MNFVESAIVLLEEAAAPLHVEELCRLALERNLLDRPGANPLRSMKGRLTVEFNKGEESRLVKVDDDHWALRNGAGHAVEVAEAEPKPASKARKTKSKPASKSKTAAKQAKRPKRDAEAEVEVEEAEAKAESEVEEAEAEEAEVESEGPAVELTDEEKGLIEIYGDGSEGTTPVAVLSEYHDAQTDDEDRPMLPEIRAERRPRQRRERRTRRSKSERVSKRNGASERAQEAAAPAAAARVQIVEHTVVYGHSDELALSALEVLGRLPRGQTLPVRQLAQTMRRKKQLSGNPDQLWRMLKGNLLVSEHRRRARGLPPIVVYKGKDLFAAAPNAGRSVLDQAEARFNHSCEQLASAVEEEYQERLSKLSAKILERVIYVYLQSSGWKDISWIKRVERSSYALAVGPHEMEETLIAVRAGPEPVDRRGVGELRAGLEAKDIACGLLISPCDLSEEAVSELGSDGRPTRVLVGRHLIHELMAREVGTTWRHVQIPVLDQTFLSAILG